MSATKPPRVVVVTRATPYQQLLDRHGTREQARFFLQTRGQSLEAIEEQHRRFEAALRTVSRAIPVKWRRSRVDRTDLDRFLFEPDDIVVALGQDGLVANLAKYLNGQPVIGLDPDPGHNAGILVPHAPESAADLLAGAASGGGSLEARAMVEAELDDGQRLLALNEIFVGHRTHQSARYRLRCGDADERQSSSGVIVATGTGATGWARSIQRERACELCLPGPTERRLVFFVREAWPSVATGVDVTEGLIEDGERIELISEMDDDGVIFGDGIEADRIEFSWAHRVTLRLAARKLNLLRA